MSITERFVQYRPLLFAIAYRMLGSVQDAEDMVQEAFLRWSQAPQSEIAAPKEYLCTTVTRLCIDYLRSARVRREAYVGTWLPEPLLAEEGLDPSDSVIMSESLSTAFLLLLESLSPVERAVFLLRDVFDYEYANIARVVEKSESNCRQIARRARQRITEKSSRFPVSPGQAEVITRQFVSACAGGEISDLLALLTEEVTLCSDGGGRVRAAINPIYGADHVARFLHGIDRKYGGDLRFILTPVNGMPGVIRYFRGRLHGVLTLEIQDGRIRQIFMVLNPEKLHSIPQTPEEWSDLH